MNTYALPKTQPVLWAILALALALPALLSLPALIGMLADQVPAALPALPARGARVWIPMLQSGQPVQMHALTTPVAFPTLAPDCAREKQTPIPGGYVCPGWTPVATRTPAPTGAPYRTPTPGAFPGPE